MNALPVIKETGIMSACTVASNLALGTTTLPVALTLGVVAPLAGNMVKALVDVTPLKQVLSEDDIKNGTWMAAAVLTAVVAGTYGLPIAGVSAFNLMLLSLCGNEFIEQSLSENSAETMLPIVMTLQAPLFGISRVAGFVFTQIFCVVSDKAGKVGIPDIVNAVGAVPLTTVALSTMTSFVVRPLAGAGLSVAVTIEILALSWLNR